MTRDIPIFRGQMENIEPIDKRVGQRRIGTKRLVCFRI